MVLFFFVIWFFVFLVLIGFINLVGGFRCFSITVFNMWVGFERKLWVIEEFEVELG